MDISDVPDSIREVMDKDPKAYIFMNGLLGKLKELELRIDKLEKDRDSLTPSFVESDRPLNNKRKPGRPKGHKGTTRPKPKDVDETIELKTDACPDCNTRLTGKPVETKERFVEDIEQAKPIRRKYLIYRKWCPGCKKLVSEKPKDVIPKCRLGLNLLLFIAFYRYVLALPVNKICTVLEKYYEIHVSTATIINELNMLAKAFGEDFNRIMEEMRHEHAVNGDETGRRIKGVNHWLWAFATKTKALYVIRKSRGSKVPKEILGEDFNGVLISDFWDAYNWVKNQQKCWSHILRKTKDMREDYIVHYKLKKLYRKAKRLEKSRISKKEKLLQVGMLERGIEKLRHIPLHTKEANAFTKTLVKHKSNLFRFVTDKRVEATNNHGEGVIRPTVVMRKISGGHRSDNGARTFEVNMSVMQTWKLQKKNFFEEGEKRIREFFL